MAKIKRDAFLYLSPRAPNNQFAQCGTCGLFVKGNDRCSILGDAKVSSEMSCGLYIHGVSREQPVRAVYTREEVGLVDRQVRCENCASSDGNGHCLLYRKLNDALPNLFDLDENIEAKACCNAQNPIEHDARLDAVLAKVNQLIKRFDGLG